MFRRRLNKPHRQRCGELVPRVANHGPKLDLLPRGRREKGGIDASDHGHIDLLLPVSNYVEYMDSVLPGGCPVDAQVAGRQGQICRDEAAGVGQTLRGNQPPQLPVKRAGDPQGGYVALLGHGDP